MSQTKQMTVKEFFDAIENMEETVYQIQITNRFKKSLDLSFRRNLDLALLKDVIHTLAKGEKLEAKYRTHSLEGYKTVLWECHVKPDWLLLWQQIDDGLVLILLDTGSHSDLF
ncbi:MAG: type II toxin-antitoxin system YafQ family toxin [Candidatus Azobacteroides sp.]|nr:type II toxin-antitoxin system YafQ family toxin [Candidatus Azobacteroides sp.]